MRSGSSVRASSARKDDGAAGTLKGGPDLLGVETIAVDGLVLRIVADVLSVAGGGSAPGRRRRQRNLRFPPAKTRIVPER